MDDDFDRRYDRDVSREPSYAARHRALPLSALGTVKQQFCPGETALQASTAALLDRCPTCDDGGCVDCLCKAGLL